MGSDSLASFSGLISSPPQVDAINFYNSGTWTIFATSPYETANTLTYTNTATMASSPGWEFDLGPSITGSRTNWSSIFYNGNGATIQANNGTIISLADVTYNASSVLVQATNIINKGQIIATAFGHIKLVGSTVNLSRSSLTIPPIQGSGSANNYSRTNFSPDIAIYDEYWGEGITNLFTPGIWAGGPTAVSAATPNIAVVDPCDTSNSAPVLSFAPSFYAWTNTPDPNSVTNLTNASGSDILVTNRYFRQAVFVAVSDPNIVTNNPFITQIGTNTVTNALVRFTPSGNVSNLFQTVSVWLHATNAGDLYVIDTLGSQTNRGVFPNTSGLIPGANPLTPCTAPTFRPANYNVERVDNGFTNGSVGNLTPPPNNFLFDQGSPPTTLAFSNVFVNADVSAYQAYVDDVGFAPFGQAVLSLPGRITINANNLDLTRAVISNAGPAIVIQANNLVGSSSAVVSCQNLSYNLGSSNGTVNMLNLATNGTLPALNGTVSLWSAEWTNFQASVYFPGTTNSITNNVEYDFHVLMVDATALSSTVPELVQDLVLQTNSVISDSMNIVGTFLFNGQNLTLNGTLNLSGNNLQNWSSALAPSLLYFTNNGSLFIPNVAHFGDDRAVPYSEFVNAGQIFANGQTIRSLDLQIINGGLNQTLFGDFSATVQSLEMTAGATIYSAANLFLAANTVQLGQSFLLAGGTLNLTVTNSVSDNGSTSLLDCGNGFNLYFAPQTGSLSSSTIIDIAPSNSVNNVGPEIDHAWAGSDLGAGATGNNNNVSIGTLSLVAEAPSQLPTFRFYGATGNNAMYVKTLDLSQLTDNPGDLPSMIQIDSNMKIYFATVSVSSSFASALGAQTPASYLQATFPNQFINDANAGLSVGGTSTNIVVSGIAARPTGAFVLTWNSTAGATYSVLKSGVLSPAANWPAIVTNYPAGGALGGPLSYTDTTATVGPAFYRVMAGSRFVQ